MNGVGKRGEEIQVQEFSHLVFDVVSNIVFRRCLAPRRPCEQTGTRSASKDRCRIEVASSKQPRWRPFGQPVGFWPSKLYFHALQPTELRVKLELLRLLDEWNGRAVQTNCHMAHIFKSIRDVEGPGVFRVRLRGERCDLGHSALSVQSRSQNNAYTPDAFVLSDALTTVWGCVVSLSRARTHLRLDEYTEVQCLIIPRARTCDVRSV